jgi:serine/threonine protein kinase
VTRFSNKYEVISQLGHGSMGVVYKVRHTVLDTILAIKVLSAHLTENAELVKRFYREARVMARLQHPNIARVIDVQHDEALGIHYFIMEYIKGQTLKEYVRERGGSLGLYDVLNIIRQVARALNYSHNFNPPVIHRDIKPTNIMVEQETQRVVVMDFGIAKELGESELTQAGAILGTFKYCPPEQMRHEPLNGGADVYALGMVMYEIYTGAHLFKGLNEGDVVRKVLEPGEYEIPLPPKTLPKFAATLSKAVKKDRNQRYGRMEDFLKDLDECWALLDETQPTVISTTRNTAGSAQGEPEELTQIEEQIEKLEEERQRRLTIKLQIQVQKSKEAAARESAAQLAGDLFQQACTQEEAGRTHFKERNHPQARLAYEQADKLFAEAREKAVAELLVKKAEELRAQMAAAKQEADRYSAREKAGSCYGHALALQAQADDLWEHRSYREASQLYGQARDMFEDAHERAYRALLEEETKAAQSQIKPARDAAIGEQAEELASELFWDAVRNERRADTAYGQQEFTHSQELYRVALQKYQQARLSARGERQRRQALAACEQAQAARREAEAEEGSTGHEAYRGALEAQRQGEDLLKAQEYEQAAEAFAQAAADFGRVREEVVYARQIQALQSARGRLDRLRAAGVPAGMRERFAARFARIDLGIDEAVRSEQRQELAEAARLYEAAAEEWAQLLREVKALAAREKAEAARASLSETIPAVAPLRAWAQVAWAPADAKADAAEAAWQEQDYERAAALYESALEAYAAAASDAGNERQLERRALESQQQAAEAGETARQADAPHHAGSAYKAGTKALQKGEQALRAKHWTEATQHFAEARARLSEALEEAQRARSRDAAGTARQGASQARNAALEEAAEELFPEDFARASNFLTEAEEALAREDFQKARTLFDQSAALYRQIREQAVLARIRKAHARAEKLRREAVSLPGRRRLKQADKAFHQGEHLSGKGSHHEALEKYNEAVSLYSKVLQAAAAPPLISKLPARFLRYSALVMAVVFAIGIYYLWPGLKFASKPPPVAVTPKSQAPPPPAGPSITGANPPEQELTIAEGEPRSFSVTATPSPGPALRYEWYLDGEKRADGPLWTYRPGFADADGKSRELKVVVTDGANLTATRSWRVNVANVNRRPHIGSVSPESELLELYPGEAKDFSASASDPDEKDQLTYRWFVDGQEVSRGQRWQYRAAAPEGRHTVSVEVADPGGSADRRQWNVQIKAPRVVLAPPEISRASPEMPQGQALTIRKGESQPFTVSARSPQGRPLRYAWLVDGKKKGEGPEWVYTPDMAGEGPRPEEVELVVTDSEGQTVRKAWKVSVLDAGRPPRIVKSSPGAGEILRLGVNETRTFSAEAADPDQGDRLAYLWLLDGKKVAEESRWQFRAPAVVGNHKVELKVSDQDGLSAARSWNIMIELPPARLDIVKTTPGRERIKSNVGETLSFAVTARMAGGPEAGAENGLSYQWTLNDEPPETTNTGEFQVDNLGPGKHRLTVVVIGPDGMKSRPRRWIVDVRPTKPDIEIPEEAEPAAPEESGEPEIREPEEAKPGEPETRTPKAPEIKESKQAKLKAPEGASSKAPGITESEVKAWLDSYQRAWQDRDIGALVRLGEVQSQNAGRLQDVLEKYDKFRVSLQGVSIRIEGSEATVTFKRVDTINGTSLTQPDRKTVVLEKAQDGRLLRRK